jgi:pilus assembly protein CpaC
LGDIPIIKNLFRSRALNKNNTELMVLVTPELVQPFQEGQAPPLPKIDRPYLEVPGRKPVTNNRVKGAAPAQPPKGANP